jgi:hypothetical protein
MGYHPWSDPRELALRNALFHDVLGARTSGVIQTGIARERTEAAPKEMPITCLQLTTGAVAR